MRQPEPWRSIVAGGLFTCALSDAGRAWCWGNNFLGYLGVGFEGPNTPVPQQVTGNHQFRQLIAGGVLVCGIDVADELWCWGYNGTGLLALPLGQQFSATPVRVSVP
jgi:alpha-tubulin suppressor-like RCC1 family protein